MQQTAQPIQDNKSLDLLCAKLVDAKAAEKDAAENRKAIESQLMALMPDRHEGANSTEGDFFKLTITEGLSRKVTEPVALASEIAPAVFNKLIRVKYEINTRTLKALEEFQPDVHKTVCKYIESTPRKASVKVEAVNE